MIFTARFAHLADKPLLNVGDTLRTGQVIGIMGSTGKSTGAHVHIDVVEGTQIAKYTLNEMERGQPRTATPRQALYFVDKMLFGIDPVITTHYADPAYFAQYQKVHLGYDVVPSDRHTSRDHFNILWPRTMPGKVVAVGYDAPGYGHYIHVSFSV